MKTYTISKLAQSFGLSRSTLLYYDRIGLLQPSGRTRAGYRCYSEKEYRRLEGIFHFRKAGLSIRDIFMLQTSQSIPQARILKKRLQEIGCQIVDLRNQQRLLTGMLEQMGDHEKLSAINKNLWTDMLRAAGLDDRAMALWHQEFEKRAPDAHQEFLLSLGLSESEALRIRKWAG